MNLRKISSTIVFELFLKAKSQAKNHLFFILRIKDNIWLQLSLDLKNTEGYNIQKCVVMKL